MLETRELPIRTGYAGGQRGGEMCHPGAQLTQPPIGPDYPARSAEASLRRGAPTAAPRR